MLSLLTNYKGDYSVVFGSAHIEDRFHHQNLFIYLILILTSAESPNSHREVEENEAKTGRTT